jgi:hypothetical protein
MRYFKNQVTKEESRNKVTIVKRRIENSGYVCCTAAHYFRGFWNAAARFRENFEQSEKLSFNRFCCNIFPGILSSHSSLFPRLVPFISKRSHLSST